MPRKHDDPYRLPSGLLRFPGLQAQDFLHPLDRDALAALEQIPVLDSVVRFLNKHALERRFYLESISSSVRINERMLPKIYEKFRWALKILDLEADLAREDKPEPELYVTHNPFFNALTAGTEQTFIVLHSSLIEGFSEREWLYIIGHELGHVKAGHVLYQTIAVLILIAMEQFKIPGVNLLLVPLFEWLRKAELTADRAGALCVQDERTCQAMHMKMAGGVRSLYDEMDLEEFLRQVDLYARRSEHIMDLLFKVQLTLFRTHPFPIFRAMELREWMGGYAYERLLKRGRRD